MLLQVVHPDGNIETISLQTPISVHEGKNLNRIRCADGMEHFFDKEGKYDGWGKAIGGVGMTEEAANAKAMEIEKHRFIHKE